MSSPLLELRHVAKRYPGVIALDDVSLTLERGEIHALVGENGAGKSTLMKILSGAERRDAGEITLDGEPIGHATLIRRARGINMIYQSSAWCRRRVAANVLGAEPHAPR
ncbi:MAG: ATP-binding cassette domain-containing protein [Planctomycetota bacterium]